MIRVLSKEIIDKIAAGEVVERPQSVVKELLDNALDAGASAISIEIREGGSSLIRITDNGCGIPKEEIKTAFLRHATSKLTEASDLFRIRTMGFRGEALASICGVSEVELITKEKDAMFGSRYRIEGGVERDLTEIGAPEGTSILVRNLFYNVPARKKFLKSKTTETAYIADIAEKTALSRPDVSISLTADGKNLLHTSGNGRLRDVIYTIFGKEIAAALLEVDVLDETSRIRISGYIGKPVIARAKRDHEIYFVNGRCIRSNVLERAVEEAYAPFMMQHRFPFAVLDFQMDTGSVDVNVHPQKTEVRFSDHSLVYEAARKAVEQVLKNRELISEAPVSVSKKADSAPVLRSIGEANQTVTDKSFRMEPFEARKLQKEAERLSGKQDLFMLRDAAAFGKEYRSREEASAEQAAAGKMEKTASAVFSEAAKTIETREAAEKAAETEKTLPRYEQQRLDTDRFLSPSSVPQFQLIGQVFKTYWIIEYHDSMYLIDQHAAHEKVNYERFMKLIKAHETLSQMLMPPLILHLSLKEAALLNDNMEVFAELGYEIEHGGDRDYVVRGIPSNLPGLASADRLLELIASLSEERSGISKEPVKERIASMSCKAAVKGGSIFRREEMEALIGELLTLENPYACPHGRPTIVKWSKYEVDKLFKRIV